MFRQRLRRLGESLFLCSCKEKVTKKKAGPGREPAGEAGRCPALLGRAGAAHNSLRSDTWAAFLPPGLRCLVRFTGRGERQQQQQQQQQQRQERRQKPSESEATAKARAKQQPRQQPRQRERSPGCARGLVGYAAAGGGDASGAGCGCPCSPGRRTRNAGSSARRKARPRGRVLHPVEAGRQGADCQDPAVDQDEQQDLERRGD